MTIIVTILGSSIRQYDDQDTMRRRRRIGGAAPCLGLPLPLSLEDPKLTTDIILVIYD